MKFSILIVDDEKNIREGLGRSLEMDGYEVLLAEDGKQGWNLVNEEHVDLIIADLKMPGMSGEELLKRISSAYPTIPVIILTGHGTIESAVEAMRNGAFDFVTKPVNLDRLSLLAKRALSNREL
ncbi:MAG: sigma-54-dependent transcriptional regulator, partial [Spirochaetota bacterium]